MRRWSLYAGTSGLLVALAALAVGLSFDPQVRLAIWVGLAAAWLVQAFAFALLLVATRRRAGLLVVGWTAGTFLRLAVLAVAAWLSLAQIWDLPAEPTLLSLVTALFVLLALEPVVFRYGLEVR